MLAVITGMEHGTIHERPSCARCSVTAAAAKQYGISCVHKLKHRRSSTIKQTHAAQTHRSLYRSDLCTRYWFTLYVFFIQTRVSHAFAVTASIRCCVRLLPTSAATGLLLLARLICARLYGRTQTHTRASTFNARKHINRLVRAHRHTTNDECDHTLETGAHYATSCKI